jgi:hypothetical protein
MVNIKVRRKQEADKVLEKTLNLLYHLEDLTDYRINTISQCVNKLQKVKLIKG